VTDPANAYVMMRLQLRSDDGCASDLGGSPFACKSDCARRRERPTAGGRPNGKRFSAQATLLLSVLPR